jgi:hypothetical protein
MLARFRKSLRVFMVAALALNFLTGIGPVPSEVRAQDRVIVIKAEQPNVWTLEQAHYLLAQMHRRDLDLRAKRLEDLDANEIAGLHFDIMRMLVEFGATFNQADLAANRLLSVNQTFNSERRQQLLGERDSLSKESLQLEGDIDGLKAEKADTDDADAQKRIDAKIAAKTAQQAKVDKRIEQIDTELGTLTAPSGQLKATEGGATFEPDRLPKSAFDDAFKAAAAKQIEKFNDAPKINASLQLDNFLQLQYEIISKQLTLLRDEVGPGERLLFLELPQSVNVTHHEADKKWAQSWWKIAGYTKRVPVKNTDGTFRAATAATPTPEPSPNQKPITTSDDINSLFGRQTIKVEAELRPKRSPTPTPDPKATSDSQKTRGAASAVYEYTNTFVNLDNPVNTAQDGFDPELKAYLGENGSKVSLSNRLVRTVELIPRQGSINVNDMKLRTTAGAFNFVLSTLFGFGSRLNIERQREQFSQFVQQELYSSAFGKGSREFGWTFTPMPGTDRLMSGVRTTYAAVVVPDDATSLVLEYNGCYFPRSQYPPNDFADTKDAERWNKAGRTSRQCGGTDSRAFIVPIPSANIEGGNDFWIKTISYQPVPKGGTAVVHISGKNISPQIGALVNGVSLPQSIGLAQPLIRDDSEAGRETTEELKDSPIQGHIERVDVTSIVLSFKMPADYAGTPTITLIAPGRSVDINWIPNLDINEARGTSLIEYTKNNGKMFGQTPKPDAFRIDAVRVFRSRSDPKHLTALVSGGGFTKTINRLGTSDAVAHVLINGSDDSVTPNFKSPSLLTIDFPVPEDDSIKVTLVSIAPKPEDVETVDSEAVPNPARLTISDVKVVTFEPATKDEPATLVVKITGTGFTDKLKATIGTKTLDVAVKSATEALLTLTDPKAASVVTLTDPDTGQQVQTVVTRKTKSKE